MLNFKEFIKFGYQTNITTTIVPNDDMVHIFRALVRERRDGMTQHEIEDMGLGINSLTPEDFKKALIRVAILGQDLLGGTKGDKLETKLESKDTNKPPIGRSRGRSSQHSAMSMRGNMLAKQNSLNELKTSASGHDTDRKDTLSRKSRDKKLLTDIAKEKDRQDKQMSVKIENKRMSKAFDVSIITAKTVEALLNYIQLQSDDDHLGMDKKLNKQRIEIQGVKPNKVKKDNRIEKMEDERGQQASEVVL